MEIQVEQNNEVMTIHLGGRLDTLTAPKLDVEIEDLPQNVTNLVLDLKDLNYISSAGLRVLLTAQKKMNKIGSMKVLNVCPEVMEVFKMTGFEDILVIE